MITWITNNIAIGNSSDARTADKNIFNYVLNVAIDLDIADDFRWRHKIGLLDGPGNHPAIFRAIIELLVALTTENKRVLVHCHEGKSRSVMVVSTYVSILKQEPLENVLKTVMQARGVDTYRPALYDLAKLILSERQVKKVDSSS